MSVMRFWSAAIALLLPIVSAHAADQPVTIRFAAMVGDQPFQCGRTYDHVGTSGSRVTPSDFRLFVSNLRLRDAAGNPVPVKLEQDGKWQLRELALLDFEDKSGPCANGTKDVRSEVIGTVPAGTYNGLVFTLGVPPDLNHQDATLAASPLNLTAMFWNWQGGYKFFRVDLATDGVPQRMPTGAMPMGGQMGGMKMEGAEKPAHVTHGGHMAMPNAGFLVHLGSTGCNTTGRGLAAGKTLSCSSPNRPEIALPAFDPAKDTIVIDLAALLATTNVDVNQPQTAPGCMSETGDGDCAGMMAAFGLPFMDHPAGAQTAFKVR